jgi:hypothetical protein
MKTEFNEFQKNIINGYEKKWFEIGTGAGKSTDLGKKKCEYAISSYYEYCGKQKPKNFIWVNSPLEAEKLIKNFDEIAGDTEDIDVILKRLRSKDFGRVYVNTDLWGSLDSYWIAFYLCGEKLCGKKIYPEKERKQLNNFVTIAKNAFWWYGYSETCIISERPKAIHINSEKKLSKDLAPALEFFDGYSLYYLNGIKMPKNVVVSKPEELSGINALNEENVDVRREYIRKIGIEKFIRDTNAVVLDKFEINTLDKKCHLYELIKVDLGKDVGEHKFLKMQLKMKNNKTVIYVEGVDDACSSAEEAFYFRYPELNGSKLSPEFIS